MTNGGSWGFDVPANLAKCVGRYARIPEFAARSHLLASAAMGNEQGD
jgi:hypothetical protein